MCGLSDGIYTVMFYGTVMLQVRVKEMVVGVRHWMTGLLESTLSRRVENGKE